MTRHILLSILGLCYCCQVTGEPHNRYSFTINGETDPWVVFTEGEDPVQGDVIHIGDYYICLDAPGVYNFEVAPDNMLRRVMPDGTKPIVACKVTMIEGQGGSQSRDTNPLASMSDHELKSLRGVSLGTWPDGIDALLAKLDIARVCLEVSEDALGRGSEKLKSFPSETAHLILSSSNACSDFTRTYLKIGYSMESEMRMG